MKLLENQVKNITRQALNNLNVDTNIKGYSYIQYIVWLEYLDYLNNRKTNLSDLYLLCSEEFNTNAQSVERCVRYAISMMDLSSQYYNSILNCTPIINNKNILGLLLQFVVNHTIVEKSCDNNLDYILDRIEKLESEITELKDHIHFVVSPFN